MRCLQCKVELPLSAKEMGITRCTTCGIDFNYDVTDVFEDGAAGIVRERRPGQVAMAQLIDENLYTDEQTVMLLEGGTGIGKSYAYLIPPMLKHREEILIRRLEGKTGYEQHEDVKRFLKGKIYVSTTKIQLQARICDIDLNTVIIPKLGLAPEINAIILKGSKHYACLHPAVTKNLDSTTYQKEYENFIRTYRDNKEFAEDGYWEGEVPKWWTAISLENCVCETDKRQCPHSDYCRPDLNKYNVIVTNHALMTLLMAKNLLRERTRYGILEMLVVDEAHLFVSSLYKACTESVTMKSLAYWGKKINKDPYVSSMAVHRNVDLMLEAFNVLHKACLNWSKASGSMGGILLPKEGFFAQEQHIVSHLYPAFMTLLDEVRSAMGNIANNIKPREEAPTDPARKGVQKNTSKDLEGLAAYARLTKYYDNLMRVRDTLVGAMATFTTGIVDKHLPTVTDDGISVIPANIGEYAQQFLDGVPKSLFLSATLSLGGNFSYIKNQLGLNRPPLTPSRPTKVVEGIYQSPFNYTQQGFSYTPIHVAKCPTYKSSQEERDAWYVSMAEEIVMLTEHNGGDAFVLFTSRSDMDRIYEHCRFNKPANSKLSYVLQDKEGTIAEEQYRNTKNAVLFGVKSFWEGVDIPGDKLRMVIIVKLPFPMLSDPVIAIEERKAKANGVSVFEEVQIPRMLFDLKQAAGRLIRTMTDRGVVAVLDSRIWTGGQHWLLKGMQADQLRGRVVTPLGYGAQAMKVLNFKYRVDNKQMFIKMHNRLYEDNPVK